MRMARALALATALAAAVPAAAAPATTTIDSGPARAVNAYGGELVWSKWVGHGAALFRRTAAGVERVPLPLSTFDVQADLGPAATGDGVVAIYRRCTKKSCAIHELDLASGRERLAPRLRVPPGGAALAPSFFKGAIAYVVEGRRCKPRVYVRSAGGPTRLVSDARVNQLGRGPGPYFSGPATDLDATRVAWSAADTYGPLFVAPRSGGKPIRLATGDAGAEFEYQVRSPQLRDDFVYWSVLDINDDGDHFLERRAVAATGKRCGSLETPGDLDSTSVDGGRVFVASDGADGGAKGLVELTGEFSGTVADC
jgi:hypothetical protein